jgi:excisionase family DNA binding protein
MDQLDQLVTVRELALRLGISPRRIRRAIRSGSLRAFRIGSWWRIRAEDADGWLESQRYRPAGERLRDRATAGRAVAAEAAEPAGKRG